MEMAFHNSSSSLNFLLLEVEIIWSERRSEASHRLGIMRLPGHPQEGIILNRTQQGRFLCCCSVWPHWSPLGSLSWLSSGISVDSRRQQIFFVVSKHDASTWLKKTMPAINKLHGKQNTKAGSPGFCLCVCCVCVCNDCACNKRWIYVLLDMTKSPYVTRSYSMQKLDTIGLALLCISSQTD